MRASQNDPLWASALRRLEEAHRAIETATAALVDLTECSPDDPEDITRRAFDKGVALDALAVVEHSCFYAGRELRGERIPEAAL